MRGSKLTNSLNAALNDAGIDGHTTPPLPPSVVRKSSTGRKKAVTVDEPTKEVTASKKKRGEKPADPPAESRVPVRRPSVRRVKNPEPAPVETPELEKTTELIPDTELVSEQTMETPHDSGKTTNPATPELPKADDGEPSDETESDGAIFGLNAALRHKLDEELPDDILGKIADDLITLGNDLKLYLTRKAGGCE